MSSGVTGDFGRLTNTINALKRLARVPSRVAAIAAPRIAEQMQKDTRAQRNPYGQGYAPHMPATVRRWGAHPILNLTGQGLDSLDAKPMAGAGIQATAGEHMRFTQGGTVNQDARTVLPDNAGALPKSWTRILDEATAEAAAEALKGAG
jgi:hypothetical protein